MSFQAMAWAVRQNLPSREKLTILMLANYADDRGKAWPSNATLARDTGMTRKTVITSLKALVERGLLTIHSRSIDGANLSNLYILNMALDAAGDEDSGVTDTPVVPDGDEGVVEQLHHPSVTVTHKPIIEPIKEEREEDFVAPLSLAKKKKATEGQSNGSRLPEDWEPSEDAIAFAKKHNVPWQSEAEKFRDYWSAQAGAKGRKADWTATWRNWIRRAAERRKDWPSIGVGAGTIQMAPVAPQKPAKPMSPQEEFDSKYRSGSYAQTIGHRYIRYLEQEWPWWNAAWGPSPGEDGSEFTPELLDELRKAREALDHSVFGREAIYTWAGAVLKPIAHDDVIEF